MMDLQRLQQFRLRFKNHQNPMLDPIHEYCFCFYLRKITLADDSSFKWVKQLKLRIEIHRHEHFVFSTSEIACTPNESGQLVLSQENATFTLHLPDLHAKQNGQIRLYQTTKEDDGRLVGCYEFLLNNYVKAYQELNRNAIELRVQISENYVISYDVFIEKTEEALQRLIKEHETARKFHMQSDDISEIDSFLPHEIINQNLENIYQQIKIDQAASPLLVNQRFWSPKRERPDICRNARMEKNQKHDSVNSTMAEDHSRPHMFKLHKSFSSVSAEHQLGISKKELMMQEDEVQSLPQTEDRFKAFKELYRVIECDSKIIQPEQLQEHQRSRINEQKPLQFIPKTQKTSKKSSEFHFTLKYVAFIMVIIVAAALLVSTFQLSTNVNYGKKFKRTKNKR